MSRCLLGLCAACVTACEPDLIEMDPAFQSRSALCADVDCTAGPPRCTDGGSSCLTCLCCPCTAGESRCDPARSSVRWQCQSGCFVDDPCPTAYETCDATSGTATCVVGTIDCERVHPYELIAICGENEALCAQCGCIDCSDIGPDTGFCDDFRPSSDFNSVLACSTTSGCVERTPCTDGAHCLQGLETGIAGCSDEITCTEVGCTGLPVCDEPASVCGDCGCCRADAGYPNTCGLSTSGAGHSRFLFDDSELCYDEVACPIDDDCTITMVIFL
jgi:hypothetical protein